MDFLKNLLPIRNVPRLLDRRGRDVILRLTLHPMIPIAGIVGGFACSSEFAGTGRRAVGTVKNGPVGRQEKAAGRLRSSVGPSVGAAPTGSHSVNDRNREARVTSRVKFDGAISTAALKTFRSPKKTTCCEARVAAV